jgi:hypothetical protein
MPVDFYTIVRRDTGERIAGRHFSKAQIARGRFATPSP